MEQPEPILTLAELMNFYKELARMQPILNDTSEPPSRHDDYLPLNLWDETPDE